MCLSLSYSNTIASCLFSGEPEDEKANPYKEKKKKMTTSQKVSLCQYVYGGALVAIILWVIGAVLMSDPVDIENMSPAPFVGLLALLVIVFVGVKLEEHYKTAAARARFEARR